MATKAAKPTKSTSAAKPATAAKPTKPRTAAKPARPAKPATPRTVRFTHDLNQTQLIEAVAAELGVSQDEARKAVHAFIDVVARALASGHNVAITNFVSFISYRKNARKARNPQTGSTVRVPAHQAVRVRVLPRLAEVVRSRKPSSASMRKLPKGSLSGGER